MRLSLARVLLCAVVPVLGVSCNSQPQPQQAASHEAAPPTPQAPATPAPDTTASRVRYDGPLPPIPSPGYEAPRPPDVMQAVYEFAGRRPDVLRYVPCFCGCERSGHVGNDDCFVKSRDASGKPEWDTHGYG